LNQKHRKIRVGAVSYLNTVPLVWGMLHGPQKDLVDLSFSLPSACACEVEEGQVEIGLAPVAEIARKKLETLPGVGITCLGAVRSILLFSKVPWKRVRTVAADLGSRTSVELARVILRERYGVEPRIELYQPVLDSMLSIADAALIIGDPALRITPERLELEYLDLGAEWFRLTGLPMVFAAWAGKPGIPVEFLSEVTSRSYAFGKSRIDEIIEQEHMKRDLTKDLAQRYLCGHIRFELGPDEHRGLHAFLELANLSQDAVTAART
jgi:chorismate dehydratase